MSDSKCILTYFNIRARAEPSRFVLAAAGVEYEDIRIERSDWPSQQNCGKYPFQRLPILEVGGTVISESRAIARYLAQKHGLYATDILQQAEIDMITDATEDIYARLEKAFLEQDEKTKKELTEQNYGQIFPKILTGLEKLLVKNKGGDGFFVGDSVTLADLTFTAIAYNMLLGKPNALDHFPKLAALKKKIEGLPRIAEWMKKRPDTIV
ncbi:hematopoietic prostaglandin D synthase-like [Glandiceps talaboti]